LLAIARNDLHIKFTIKVKFMELSEYKNNNSNLLITLLRNTCI